MTEKLQYWLLKVEPSDYSWSKMMADKKTVWNGIRNHQAQNYLRSMQIGDTAFYYHTEKERAIVGIVRVVKTFYHSNDPKFGEVDVEAIEALDYPVTLETIKSTEKLQSMTILKQPRLSISPVTVDEWNVIVGLSKKP